MNMYSQCNETAFSLLLGIYKHSFLTKKQTDHVGHLILAQMEKTEVIQDNTAPKSYLPLFVEHYSWAFSTNLGTRLLR